MLDLDTTTDPVFATPTAMGCTVAAPSRHALLPKSESALRTRIHKLAGRIHAAEQEMQTGRPVKPETRAWGAIETRHSAARKNAEGQWIPMWRVLKSLLTDPATRMPFESDWFSTEHSALCDLHDRIEAHMLAVEAKRDAWRLANSPRPQARMPSTAVEFFGFTGAL